MIDALFGSKTRVKLLHLFFNNEDASFYVREITRLIDEQINSVRRELANMVNVGVVKSRNSNKKLYYALNKKYEFYDPLRQIFTGEVVNGKVALVGQDIYDFNSIDLIKKIKGADIIVAKGRLIDDPKSDIDLFIAGEVNKGQLKQILQQVEKNEGYELNYVVMKTSDVTYRYSVRDKFIIDILAGKKNVIRDERKILDRGRK